MVGHWSAIGTSVPGYFDVQNVATHEAGHTLFLGDLYQAPAYELTMYGYTEPGEIRKQTLGTGDISGLQKLYGE